MLETFLHPFLLVRQCRVLGRSDVRTQEATRTSLRVITTTRHQPSNDDRWQNPRRGTGQTSGALKRLQNFCTAWETADVKT